MKRLTTIIGVAGLVTALAAGAGHAKQSTRVTLQATAGAPAAHGRAIVALRHASDGRFAIQVQSLEPRADYDVLVGGIRVATLHTNGSGGRSLRFASRPRGHDHLLGFDPRGQAIEVRGADGDDRLVGTMPGTGDDAMQVTCCLPDDGGRSECEDRTADACAAQGGTVVQATSCLPDPCGSTPPPGSVVCCLPDSAGAECEDRTQSECVALGGAVVEATSCTPNPCTATPPPPDANVQCCLPGYYTFECEDRTAAQCAADGGIDKGPGSCTPNPCGSLPPPSTRCCLPNASGSEIECEDRSAAACTAAGGVVEGAGVCAPDTCPASTGGEDRGRHGR